MRHAAAPTTRPSLSPPCHPSPSPSALGEPSHAKRLCAQCDAGPLLRRPTVTKSSRRRQQRSAHASSSRQSRNRPAKATAPAPTSSLAHQKLTALEQWSWESATEAEEDGRQAEYADERGHRRAELRDRASSRSTSRPRRADAMPQNKGNVDGATSTAGPRRAGAALHKDAVAVRPWAPALLVSTKTVATRRHCHESRPPLPRSALLRPRLRLSLQAPDIVPLAPF